MHKQLWAPEYFGLDYNNYLKKLSRKKEFQRLKFWNFRVLESFWGPRHSVETFFFNMSFSMMASCWAPYPLRLRVKHKQKMHAHMTCGDCTLTRRFLKIKERISEKSELELLLSLSQLYWSKYSFTGLLLADFHDFNIIGKLATWRIECRP